MNKTLRVFALYSVDHYKILELNFWNFIDIIIQSTSWIFDDNLVIQGGGTVKVQYTDASLFQGANNMQQFTNKAKIVT